MADYSYLQDYTLPGAQQAIGGGGINWSDPNLYISGGGTALGALSMALPYLMGNPGAFAAKQSARQSEINRNAAQNMAAQKEAQAQKLAGTPVDPTNYYNMIANAVFGQSAKAGPGGTPGVNPLERSYLANATTSWGDPSMAARTYSAEYLPQVASNYMNQAMGYANQDRTNQLNSIMWSPQLQAMLQPYGMGQGMSYANLLQQGAPKGVAGDVGALGAYFQNQATQRNQSQANTNAMMLAQQQMRQSQPMWDYYSGLNRRMNQNMMSPGAVYGNNLMDSGGGTSSDTSYDTSKLPG